MVQIPAAGDMQGTGIVLRRVSVNVDISRLIPCTPLPHNATCWSALSYEGHTHTQECHSPTPVQPTASNNLVADVNIITDSIPAAWLSLKHTRAAALQNYHIPRTADDVLCRTWQDEQLRPQQQVSTQKALHSPSQHLAGTVQPLVKSLLYPDPLRRT